MRNKFVYLVLMPMRLKTNTDMSFTVSEIPAHHYEESKFDERRNSKSCSSSSSSSSSSHSEKKEKFKKRAIPRPKLLLGAGRLAFHGRIDHLHEHDKSKSSRKGKKMMHLTISAKES